MWTITDSNFLLISRFLLKHYNTTERFQICYMTTSVLSYLVANPTKWPESAPISRNNVMNEIIKVNFTCIDLITSKVI